MPRKVTFPFFKTYYQEKARCAWYHIQALKLDEYMCGGQLAEAQESSTETPTILFFKRTPEGPLDPVHIDSTALFQDRENSLAFQ